MSGLCRDRSDHGCLESGFKLLGDFWTLQIIESLRTGEQRFCGLQRNIGGVNPVTLVSRLKRLEQSGLIERREETLDKLSVCYTLTAEGHAILPVIEAIRKFADHYHNRASSSHARHRAAA